MLLRLLSAPDGCISLGGNFIKLPTHPDSRGLMQRFIVSNQQLWDRKLSFAENADARAQWHAAMGAIESSPAFRDMTHLFFKRSSPFGQPRDQYAPDLWDMVQLRPDAKIILIYRDPRASTYSALRRKFDPDLRRLAVGCSEQLTWLAAQVHAIGPENVRLVSYSALCADPEARIVPLAEFCGVQLDQVRGATRAEGVSDATDARWRRELSAEEAGWLDRFFSPERCRQWEVLTAAD